MKVLSDDESHRYLGRLLSTSASSRSNIEFRNRIRAAWAAFHKHKSVLLEHKLSIKLRLKYFDACVGPALLFGTAVLPLSRFQYAEFDKFQRKMLRRIVDWRRVEREEWRVTMIRMNGRLARALHLYPC